MEMTLNYELMKHKTDQQIMTQLNQLSELQLFSMSSDWRENRKYILKLKGSKGDLLVYWNK